MFSIIINFDNWTIGVYFFINFAIILSNVDIVLVLYCRPTGTEEVNLSLNFGQ